MRSTPGKERPDLWTVCRKHNMGHPENLPDSEPAGTYVNGSHADSGLETGGRCKPVQPVAETISRGTVCGKSARTGL